MSSKNSPSEISYISLEVVLEIHKRQLKEFGGSDGIRNQYRRILPFHEMPKDPIAEMTRQNHKLKMYRYHLRVWHRCQ